MMLGPGRIPFLVVAAMTVLASPACAGWKSQSSGVTLNVAGPEEVVFDWTRDRCEDIDVPDLPARAIRDATGQVHLYTAHYVNRRFSGSTLNTVVHDCAVVMGSHENPNPALHDGREWLAALYTADGVNVFALVHNEYDAFLYPGQCPSGDWMLCWWASVTMAMSVDGGATFTHPPAPHHLVASIPYRYVPDIPPKGLFHPSNIILKDGFYYVLMQVEESGNQPWGTCIMRTQNLDDPTSWRAWDGTSFSVQFVNPYSPGGDSSPDTHMCQPISRNNIERMHESVTFNTRANQYLLVGTAGRYNRQQDRVVWGVYYSLSTDLIIWSPMRLLMEAPAAWSYTCGGPDPVHYPSALDPESPSRNFDTTGQTFYLYFTRFNYENCQMTSDRDLIRVPVEISASSPAAAAYH